MTIQLAYRQLLAQLYELYNTREAANIAGMVIEHVTGQPKIERIVYKDLPVSEAQQALLQKMTAELLRHRPVQYVLGEAWFMNMKLLVNEAVLIPRPETEELVQWIIEDIRKKGNKDASLLDVGTGSGCIAIAIKKAFPVMAVAAIDVSDEALQVARLNSIKQKAVADFLHLNFLDENAWRQLGRYDLLVSNPPYVANNEKSVMRGNVLLHEPHLALFVPEDDPLLFYKAIAKFSKTHLNAGGNVYLEINEAFGKDVTKLFEEAGFENIILKKDMQGRDRMIRAGLG